MALTGRAGVMLGPLTTSWSIPASCSTHYVSCATCTQGYRGQHCVSNGIFGPVEDDIGCWPPAASLNKGLMPTHPFLGLGFYSPGLACPTGYTTACTAEYGRRPQWDIQFTLVPGETAIGCCPEGFKCGNRAGQTCIAIISSETQTIVPTAMCNGAQVVSSAQATLPSIVYPTITRTTRTGETVTFTLDALALSMSRPITAAIAARTVTVPVPVREMVLLAPMFQLNYQSSDLSSITTTTTSSGSSDPTTLNQRVTDTTTGTSGTSSPSSDNLSTSAGQGGLSTSAVVGVGVGAALGGLLLGIVAILLFLRHRRRKLASPAQEFDGQWTGRPQVEYKYPVEAPVHVITEMSADPERYEAWGGHPPAELATPGRGRLSHGRDANYR